MDGLTSYLTSQKTEVSTVDLKIMGKRAARSLIVDKTPMSASIAGFAKEASLNDEQIQRVIETSNRVAFQIKMKSGYETNVDFPIAELGEVKRMMCGSKEKVAKQKFFGELPSNHKEAYLTLEDMFGLEGGKEKLASSDECPDDVRNLFFDELFQIRETGFELEKLASDVESQTGQVKAEIDQQVTDGANPFQVVALVREAVRRKEMLNQLFAQLEGQLKQLLPDLAGTPDCSCDSMVPNTEHKLYKQASALSDNVDELIRLRGNLRHMVANSSSPKFFGTQVKGLI
jgi:hypothetical protein